MGGGRGPPTGEPMRGTPGKGGGPFAAIGTLPSSVTLVGEELLELLFIVGAAPDPRSNSPLGISLRFSVAESGLAGRSAVGGGEHSPPLTGDGPKEPFWLKGPLHGGFWALGRPGLGFTITGSSCSIAIFWVNSSNLCLKLAASLFSSAIALSAARALSQLS